MSVAVDVAEQTSRIILFLDSKELCLVSAKIAFVVQTAKFLHVFLYSYAHYYTLFIREFGIRNMLEKL